jgi:hypothetical protein
MTKWWCPVCGVPRPVGWNSGKTRCECGTASATSRPMHPYLVHIVDGITTYRSLRDVEYGFGLAGVRIGHEVIPWSAGSFAIHIPETSLQPLRGSLIDQPLP